ncbi:MAG TPA: hypothetical protein VHM22_15580, partial [Bradyrhizobium sp.]|nr:hypothetical protein [Bradyrhizobium sp.]
GQPRRQRNAALGFFECLEKRFEHADHFRIRWRTPQSTQVDGDVAYIMLESKAPHETAPTIVARNFILTQFVDRHLEEIPGSVSTQYEGIHCACFFV